MTTFTLTRDNKVLQFKILQNGRKAKIVDGAHPPKYMSIEQARKAWKQLILVGWKRV
jgi:hypothetical protein